MRPVHTSDASLLYELFLDPRVGATWRYGGAHPDPEEFRATLWDGVLAHFLIMGRERGEVVGYVAARGADFRNGHVHLAAAVGGNWIDAGWPIEGVILFMGFLFNNWPFRRIYLESVDYVADRYGSLAGRYMTCEGRLVEHLFREGEYRDLLVFSLTRSNYGRMAEKFLPAIKASSSNG